MLSGLKGSLQSELNAFFPQLQNRCDFRRTVSAQAVSKSRKRFSFVVFSLLNQRLLELVESTFSVPRWHGFRVVAGDASKLRLFLSDATKRQVQEAIAFALYLSGISWLAAQQDFGAKMLCDNLNALAVFCATEQNLDAQVRSGYRINRTYTFAHLKRCLPRWLVKQWPTLDELLSVFAELAKNLVRFVKGLSKPRPPQPKPHKAMAYKSTA